MLTDAWNQFQESGDRAQFLAVFKQQHDIKKIAPAVEKYIFDTGSYDGMYTIYPFAEAGLGTPFTYDELFGRFADKPFPGFWIGYESGGVQFMLLLESGAESCKI